MPIIPRGKDAPQNTSEQAMFSLNIHLKSTMETQLRLAPSQGDPNGILAWVDARQDGQSVGFLVHDSDAMRRLGESLIACADSYVKAVAEKVRLESVAEAAIASVK